MPSFKAPVRDGIAADAGERQRDRSQDAHLITELRKALREVRDIVRAAARRPRARCDMRHATYDMRHAAWICALAWRQRV